MPDPVARVEITFHSWDLGADGNPRADVGWTVHSAPAEMGAKYVAPLFRLAVAACQAQVELNEEIERDMPDPLAP